MHRITPAMLYSTYSCNCCNAVSVEMQLCRRAAYTQQSCGNRDSCGVWHVSSLTTQQSIVITTQQCRRRETGSSAAVELVQHVEHTVNRMPRSSTRNPAAARHMAAMSPWMAGIDSAPHTLHPPNCRSTRAPGSSCSDGISSAS